MRKSASNEQQRLESADWVPIIEPTNQEPQCRFVAAAAAAVLVVAVDVVVVAAVVVAVVVVVADGAFMERTLPFFFCAGVVPEPQGQVASPGEGRGHQPTAPPAPGKTRPRAELPQPVGRDPTTGGRDPHRGPIPPRVARRR